MLDSIIHIDNIIATISACMGISYTFLAGNGKIYCYLFGITNSFLYGYLSYKNTLYGNTALNILYYLPLQIIGIFQWKKHLKPKTLEIKKSQLTPKERIILIGITFVISLITAITLKICGDISPFLDSFTAILSIIGMYLTVKRAIEQWFIWIVVNGIAIIMWCKAIYNGSHAYSTVIMWGVYFVLAIYFYIKWKEELIENTTL